MSIEPGDTQKTQAKPQHRTTRRTILWICIALLGTGLLLLGIAVGRLAWAALAVKADLDAARELAASDLQAVDIQKTATLLHTTRTDLATLRKTARPFLWLPPYLGWIPKYGVDIQAAPALLDIGLEMTSAADVALGPLLPFATQALGQGDADQGELLATGLHALHSARPQLADALAHVRIAEAKWQTLNPEALEPRLQQWMPKLDKGLALMGLGVRAGLLLPDLAGAESPTTLLVLVQNEDELRATGGFISGVARVTLAGGAVEDLVFEDSYAIDDFSHPYPDPPQPLLDYMLTELWLLRDSNWSPDWPTSAQAASDLYTISRDAQIDGVLAVDQRAIGLLIDALGPLYLEGQPEPITGANVIEIARQAWGAEKEGGGDWWWHRKDFMAAVLQAVVDRLDAGLDQAALYRLYSAATQALDEKDVLVYLSGEPSAALLSELGWDGAIRDDPGDFLMVVDTNVGFNKASALVTREIEYVIDLTDPDRPYAALTVRHHHPIAPRDAPCQHQPRYDETYEQMMERCYWDYLRVYVPGASTLTDATPHEVPASALLSQRTNPAEVQVGPPEQGRNVFATLLLVRPSETLETRFEYSLPPDVVQGHDRQVEYTLLIQKQPGTQATPVRVQVRLPEGMALAESEPEPTAATASTLTYTLTLDTDQVLRLLLDR